MVAGILVLDMINDFVYGKLGSQGAKDIIPELKEFLCAAEERGLPIIFCRDSHLDTDPEMDLWDEHAMAGDRGSQVIPELSRYGELDITKRFYDAFFKSSLDKVLQERSIDTVILTGVATDICVQHTAAGAFFRGYDVTVVGDCTASLDADKHEAALEYMKKIYGAEIVGSKELQKRRISPTG